MNIKQTQHREHDSLDSRLNQMGLNARGIRPVLESAWGGVHLAPWENNLEARIDQKKGRSAVEQGVIRNRWT